VPVQLPREQQPVPVQALVRVPELVQRQPPEPELVLVRQQPAQAALQQL